MTCVREGGIPEDGNDDYGRVQRHRANQQQRNQQVTYAVALPISRCKGGQVMVDKNKIQLYRKLESSGSMCIVDQFAGCTSTRPIRSLHLLRPLCVFFNNTALVCRAPRIAPVFSKLALLSR